MLIQFSVGNFKSFKDIATISLMATARKEHEETNTFIAKDKLRLLKNAVIYGANASGKSNLIQAMRFVKSFVLFSTKDVTDKIKVTRFKLSTETENQPSTFEIIFMHERIRYRYGFQADKEKIHREWLFYVPIRKETRLFIREPDNFTIGGHFKEGKGLKDKTRDNALFLSVVAQFNGPIAGKIFQWFKKFKVLTALTDTSYLEFTLRKLQDTEFKNEIMKFTKFADLGIEDVGIEETKIRIEDLPDGIKTKIKPDDELVDFKINAFHKKYDIDNKTFQLEKFDFDFEESAGTKKFFAISAPILDTLKKGNVLVIDELDAKLHPILIKFLIELFNSRENNPNNAQLVFVSHNTNLFNRAIFRRDQIWLTEKNKYGATDLYSLVEYKVRNDASFEKDYIAGKYGAIPVVKGTNSLFKR
ncbi:MAG: ATP-binding protein [Candidatus Omnitrophota bacterium]|nr:ATP-binding protein [Candidatus Omnitrophota bacterium]